MENFGLGLVLGFRDDASAGVMKVLELVEHLKSSLDDIGNHASGSIGQLTAMSSAIGVVGVAISGLGAAIATPFVALGSHVVQLSSQFENMEITLKSLYGSAEAGSEKLQHFMKFAADTPFQMTDIVPAAVIMKSIGQDADEMFTTMDRGKSVSQSFLSFIGDLAALRPDKGIQLATQGIKEFLEGNGRGLRTMFGMSTTGLLGEKAAGDLAGRAKQVTEMIAKMHGAGLMQNMNDTWTVIFSNIKDQFDQITYYIGKSGFFNTIKGYFRDVYKFIHDLGDDRLKAIGETISGAMEVIAMPLGLVMKGLIEFGKALVNLMEEYPMVMKFAIAITGLGAQLLVFTGVSLVVVAVLLKLRAAFLTFTGAQTIMSGFAKTLAVGLRTILTSILPVTIAIGLLYYAFRTNLFGIRTVVEGVGKFVSNFFTVLSDAMGHIDFEKGIFSLSKKNHNLADQMGITDLITAIVRLRYYWHYFTEGLSEGIDNAMEYLDNLGKRFAFLGAPIKEITGVAREFFKIFSETGHKDDVQELGRSIGNWLPILLSVAVGAKVLSLAFSGVMFAINGVSRVMGALSIAGGFLKSLIPANIGSSIAKIFSTPALRLFISDLKIAFDMLRAGFPLMDVLTVRFSALLPIFTKIQSAGRAMGSVISRVLTFMMNPMVNVKRAFESLGTTLSGFGSSALRVLTSIRTIISGFASSVSSNLMRIKYAFSGLSFSSIASKLGTVFSTVKTLITGHLGSIVTVVRSIFSRGLAGAIRSGLMLIRGLFVSNPIGLALLALTVVIGIVITHWDAFKKAASTAFQAVSQAVQKMMPTLQGVGSRLSASFQRLLPTFQRLGSLIGGIFMKILGVVATVFGAVSEVIASHSTVIETIVEVLGTIIGFAFSNAATVIMTAISVIGDILSTLMNILSDVISFVVDVFEGNWRGAWESIESIFTDAMKGMGNIAKDIIGGVVGLFDNLVSSASNAIKAIMGVKSESDSAKSEASSSGDGESGGDTGNGEALGGIFPQGDFVTHFAEDSGEAAIPIRNTAFSHSLWERTGQLIGALKPAGGEKTPVIALSSEATTSSHEGKDSSSNDSQRGESIIFEKGSIVFEVHTENFDAEKAADTLMPIIKRKAELIQMSTRRKSSFGGAFA